MEHKSKAKELLNKQKNKEGYIFDYISGIEVKATPEEVEAVQVFSRLLIEDYGYPKEYIQTRPQFRVKIRPSDNNKSYPIDIGVFFNSKKSDDDLYIVIECKKKTRKDGLSQLKDYLRFCSARMGVWFNGNEKLFILKYEKDGKVFFEEIPNIPKYGEKLDDIGKYKKKDLIVPHNLKATFKSIRNYLFANATGVTRDETLAQELINILFCKIFDEKYTKPNDTLKFRASVNEKDNEVGGRIKDLFNSVKAFYKDVFDKNDSVSLDNKSIKYVVGELQSYSLIRAERDTIADAFEVFISHALKGGQGQFFTPRNVVKMIIEILDPSRNDLLIDPACGSGGFLIESLRHIWSNIEKEGEEYEWEENAILDEEKNAAINCIRGLEKDYFLTKVTKAYMAIVGDGKAGVFSENSLLPPSEWKESTKQKIELGKFDIVVANPPFGAKIPVIGEEVLKQYDLGHNWKKNKEGIWEKGKVLEKEAPQILFIERILQFLKEGGKMGIVLPDSCFGNQSLEYLRAWLIKKVKILAIIDLPLETFLPNTSTKTSVIICEKKNNIEEDYPIFMYVAKTCGHDRRGNKIESDDILKAIDEYKKWKQQL